MRDEGADFRTGEPIAAQTVFDDEIDIHHIFPRRWCETEDIEPGTYNSIINRTAISARTNRQIGGNAPSKYLPALERAADIDPARMDEILASHRIAPDAVRTDRFWDFYATRAEALLHRIEVATGKKITREPELFRADVVPETYDEGPQEWGAEERMEVAAS